MPREKKYTRTVAFRVTAEEWELIEHAMIIDNCHKPSTWVRKELDTVFAQIRVIRAQDMKRAEAAAKRAAKKAQAANADA